MALQPGDLAPDFSLSDSEGQTVELSALRGRRVVLYFYPRDNTPGCTQEACSFRDHFAAYQERGVLVFGVSTDDAKSHARFMKKHQLPFPLLCDPGGVVATAYESYGLKKFMGKEFQGVFRNTFVIGPDGRIERIYRKVKPAEHGVQVLTDLDVSQPNDGGKESSGL